MPIRSMLAFGAVFAGCVGSQPPLTTTAPRGCGWTGPEQSPAQILAGAYETKMISRGDNRPGVDLVGEKLDAVSILLHHHVQPDAIRRHFTWTDAEYARRLQLLLDEGLARRDPRCGVIPTAMVISQRDGARLYTEVEPVARELAAAITAHLPELQQRYAGLAMARTVSFARASFVIVSNGLLDNGQIGAVEQAFLGVERTARGGKHYYEAFLEQAPGGHVEAFGIYGNATHMFGPVMVALYGNARSGHNFVTLTPADLTRDFGMPVGADPDAFKIALAAELAAAFDGTAAPHARGFEALGLMHEGTLAMSAFHAAELPILDGMAKLVLPELLAILEHHRAGFEAAYRDSDYRDEISFAEYFAWTYHFLYTRTTNLLATGGVIEIPPGGVATYLVE